MKNQSFLKKVLKNWRNSWRGAPFEPAEKPAEKQKSREKGGGFFAMLNSLVSSGSAGFTLLVMLVTTAVGVYSVVFDTVLDLDSPISLRAMREKRAAFRDGSAGGLSSFPPRGSQFFRLFQADASAPCPNGRFLPLSFSKLSFPYYTPPAFPDHCTPVFRK